MGGGEQGASGGQSQEMQQLLQQLQRQQTAGTIKQGFQQFGAAVGQGQPYMQQPSGAPIPQFGQGQANPATGAPPAGALFPQQGMGGGGMTGAGVNEQQLAMILKQLGYG